jgi:putative tricarboxylic transport membrane protein
LAFGVPELLDGLDVVTVAVALFAIGETLYVACYLNNTKETIQKIKGRVMMTADDWKRSWPAWLRGTAIGFPFGSIPAGGTEIPTFLSYFTEKKLSKHPEEFGHGAIEGVAGPEAANNATVTGALVPLLTLGIPVSATAAILLSAFQQYGITPGPLLFQNSGALVWGLIASLYIGNVLLLILNLPMVGIWIKLLEIPKPQLYGGIMLFAVLGVYSLHQSAVDVLIMIVVGLMGFVMQRFDFPVTPAIVGLILGPMSEQQFRRAMAISQGDITTFMTRPISGVIMWIVIGILVMPPLVNWYKQHRNK